MNRWTKDEIEIAWALRRLGGTSIKCEENGTLMVYGEDLMDNIYFPDIKCGETVSLDDIISSYDPMKWELGTNNPQNGGTVDAVPVVRCKDCKYYNRNLGEGEKNCIYLMFATHALSEECIVKEDDFCSHAEK